MKRFEVRVNMPHTYINMPPVTTFHKTLHLFYAKNGSKKQLILEKWKQFENWQNWPPSKGYSLCEMTTFGKLFSGKMREFWKTGKNGHQGKAIAFAKWPLLGQKLKMQEQHDKKVSTRHCSCSMPKTVEKTATIRKIRAVWKWEKLQQSKGFTLCKMVTLSQKSKMQKNLLKTFLGDTGVVLCKNCSKKSYYSKNESSLKIGKNGHQAKAIAFARWSLWVKN